MDRAFGGFRTALLRAVLQDDDQRETRQNPHEGERDGGKDLKRAAHFVTARVAGGDQVLKRRDDMLAHTVGDRGQFGIQRGQGRDEVRIGAVHQRGDALEKGTGGPEFLAQFAVDGQVGHLVRAGHDVEAAVEDVEEQAQVFQPLRVVGPVERMAHRALELEGVDLDLRDGPCDVVAVDR